MHESKRASPRIILWLILKSHHPQHFISVQHKKLRLRQRRELLEATHRGSLCRAGCRTQAINSKQWSQESGGCPCSVAAVWGQDRRVFQGDTSRLRSETRSATGLRSTTKGITVATKELARDHGDLAQLPWPSGHKPRMRPTDEGTLHTTKRGSGYAPSTPPGSISLSAPGAGIYSVSSSLLLCPSQGRSQLLQHQ